MIGIGRRLGVVALALGLLGAQAHAQASWAQPYFSPNGGGAEATAAMIDSAKERIDIAMYSISSGPTNPIWGALQRAVARGVRVRLILNEATGANKSKADALAGIGVHVFGVGSRTLHEKFALIDAHLPAGRAMANGSANWSLGAMTKYSENTIVYRDSTQNAHLVWAFQQEFNRLITRGVAISANAAANKTPVDLGPAPQGTFSERPTFSSTNTSATTVCANEINAAFRSAQRSIYIDVAHFNTKVISSALIQLHKDRPGVKIEVLLDLGEYADSKSRARDLERAGISVRYKMYSLAYLQPRAQLMHHKTVIVDEATIVTGSYNWSDTAEGSNFENVVTITPSGQRNVALAAAFVAEHKKLWNLNRDVYPRFRAAMLQQPGTPGFKPVVPVHFDTPYFNTIMTLSRSEIAPVRAAGFASGLLERLADGTTKKNNDATYLDRVAKTRLNGAAPQGTFLDPVPTNGPGITGSVPGQ